MIPVGDAPFNGIYPATICPLNAAAAIDEPALAQHVSAMADVPGCVGVLCSYPLIFSVRAFYDDLRGMR